MSIPADYHLTRTNHKNFTDHRRIYVNVDGGATFTVIAEELISNCSKSSETLDQTVHDYTHILSQPCPTLEEANLLAKQIRDESIKIGFGDAAS
jgi:hypothetical protein